MRFSVLIPTFNRREVLFRTLSSVFAQEFPAGDFEVIVVVDGSTDGTLEMLQALQPRCGFRFISQSNRGLPAARNAGIEAAAGELVLLLDDDIVCDPMLLRRHADQHATADNLVVFGPVPLDPDSPPGLAADRWRAWSDAFQARLKTMQECRSQSMFLVAATAPAVNRSLSRAVLLSIGGCDEEMRDCHEDWDLGIRLWKAGLQFRYEPEAVAYHLYIKSDRDIVPQDARLFARGEVALSRKHTEYRPYSSISGVGGRSRANRLLLRAIAALPFSLEPILRPVFLAMNTFRGVPAVHRAGLGLLEDRCSLEIYREAVRVTGSRKALRAEFGMRLPVLAYHHVGIPKPGAYPDLTVTADRFERQIRWLSKRGYRGISPADWLRWRRDCTRLPKKPVIVSFDDAFADIAEYALPVLQRYGFGAIVFVVTGQIGGTNAWDEERGSAIHPLMTAEQLRYWADRGIEFGAHSLTHPDLATTPKEVVADELLRSRDELEALIGRRVTAFAYPYGRYDQSAIDIARGTFEVAFTTDEGLNNLRTDPFLLKRSCVRLSDSRFDLECLLRWGLRPLQLLWSRIRLGNRISRTMSRLRGGRRKIFLDCGTHLGQGLRHFQRRGVIDSSWEIHAFEANPACQLSRRMENLPLRITAHDCAVWVHDGQIEFRQENHKLSQSGSPTDGESSVDRWGSSVASVRVEHPGYEPDIVVPCIDFSRFVRELPSSAKIVCKLNVEGSEFAILRRMLSDGTIEQISKLYVEFHPEMVPSETDESVSRLVRQIRNRGVLVDTSEIYDIPYSLD